MSILDDAIREHLELKRAHGGDDAEVKRLEDEAFGPPQRPDEHDPFAEAPTEFLVAPEVGAGEQPDEGQGERRAPNIADLQEAPEPRQAPDPAPQADAPADAADDGPAEEEHPAMEHEAIVDAGPSTEERHAIADQPTEIFDVEGQFEDAATEADSPPAAARPGRRGPSRASPRSTRWPGSRSAPPAPPKRPRPPPRTSRPTNSTSSSASSASQTSSTRRSRRLFRTSRAHPPPRKPPPSSSISTRRRTPPPARSPSRTTSSNRRPPPAPRAPHPPARVRGRGRARGHPRVS